MAAWKTRFIITLIALALPVPGFAKLITSADQLATEGVRFTWSEVRSKSLRIVVEYQDEQGAWRRVNLGSGFLISADGLFVTAYHVVKYCLAKQYARLGLSVKIDCSSGNRRVRYKAINGDREFAIEILSFLKEADATSGKSIHTPDEILKQRDFVIGRVVGDGAKSLAHWELREFDESAIDLSNPRADFQLTPLMPPKRVFVVGFPTNHDFVISEGFLNLTEKNRRGYFAADLRLYSPSYLRRVGIAIDTQWGLEVENHMSGGVVIDQSGRVVGLVVNGNRTTAGILSIENVLMTFFSRTAQTEIAPSIFLNPTETPLYLRRSVSD